jgi:purine-binding chemotaxis protein CheW
MPTQEQRTDASNAASPLANMPNNAENSIARQYLTFTVGAGEYGVDIMKVREIRGWSETTRIPNSPEYMRGVINLRGLVIPIFDLRTRFHQGITEVTEKNVVIVLAVGNRTIGILVDTVSDILNIDASELKEAPTTSDTDIDDRYVQGLISVKNKMVIILYTDSLFDQETLNAAQETTH